MLISGDKYPDAVPCRFAWVIILTIRHYPDELSRAVCTCLHLSCLSDGVLETKRHNTLIPLMGDFGHLLGHVVMLLLLSYTPAQSTYASLCDKLCLDCTN